MSATTHGMSGTKIFGVWCEMRHRCNSPKHPMYDRYGGRGITVCDEWNSSFEAFYRDMGDAPFGMSLDRKDNDGPYCKDNCRWATLVEQCNNTRRNRHLTFQGRTQTLSMWARELGVKRSAISERLRRGHSVESALTPGADRRFTKLTFAGKTMGIKEWAAERGIAPSTLADRLRRGMPVGMALDYNTQETYSPRKTVKNV